MSELLVWSKGYGLYFNVDPNYVFAPTEQLTTKNDIVNQKGNNIWVKMGSGSYTTNYNFKILLNYLKTLDYSINLYTTDGDSSIPGDIDVSLFNQILSKVNIWYTQNISDTTIPKLKGIPIGLDLHTYNTNGIENQINELKNIRLSAKGDRILKIYCDVHLSQQWRFGNPRRSIGNLRYPTIVYQNTRLPRSDLWKVYSEYTFVISTHGNGLDAHRTWELLLLGCIVITKTSSIDILFKDLPVVIIQEWEELKNEENLVKWYEQYNQLTDYNYIWNKLKIN